MEFKVISRLIEVYQSHLNFSNIFYLCKLLVDTLHKALAMHSKDTGPVHNLALSAS